MDSRPVLNTDLYCLTAEKFSRGRSNIKVVTAMLDAGVKLIQYREKEKSMGKKYEECLKIRQMTREAAACFIVNDNLGLAMAVNADGIHVGQDDLPVSEIRRLTNGSMIIGLSTHSPDQARQAEKLGVDYIGVGPIFRTFTKEDVCDPVGFDYLEYVVNNIKTPFVAIGGIKEHNLRDVVKRGAGCVAMVTEIVGAADIKGKITQLRNLMTV